MHDLKQSHLSHFAVGPLQTDAHPKEVYCNLYGIHCDPAQPFQWERVAGTQNVLLVHSKMWLVTLTLGLALHCIKMISREAIQSLGEY